MRTMSLIPFFALTFSALGVGPGLSHALEMPGKLRMSPDEYMRVTSSLYRLFGVAGGTIQLGALAFTGWTAWSARASSVAYPGWAAGTVLFFVSLAIWAVVVQPVNARWAKVLEMQPALGPSVYAELRHRWEFGHLAAFVAWLAGYISIAATVVRQLPAA